MISRIIKVEVGVGLIILDITKTELFYYTLNEKKNKKKLEVMFMLLH